MHIFHLENFLLSQNMKLYLQTIIVRNLYLMKIHFLAFTLCLMTEHRLLI